MDVVSRGRPATGPPEAEVVPDAPADDGPDSGADLRSLARGGVFALSGSVIAGVLGFVLTILMTRGFDQVTVGIVFTMVSVFLVAFTVVKLGASTGVVYFVARLSALGDSHRLRSALRSALTPVVATSLVAAAALIVLAGPLARLIVPDHPQQAIAPLRALALILPFAAVMDVCLFGSRGLHRLRPLVVVDKIGRPLLQVALVGVCVAVGAHGTTVLALAWGVPYVPAAVVAAGWLWYLLVHVERRRGVTHSEPGTMHREFWAYTWPRWMQSISQIGLQRLDIVLVAGLAGPTEAAVYAAVTRFLVFGQLAAGSIGAVVQPRLSRLVALDDHASLHTVYRVSTTWLILTTWPLYLGFVVLARQLPLVFGPKYATGASVLVVLGLAMLVATACGIVDMVLAMAGRTLWTFANSVVALVIMVGLDLLLIPPLGIFGAALGWGAAILFNNLTPLTQLAVSMRLHPFGRSTFTAAAVALGTMGVVPGALALGQAPASVLLAAFGAGVLVYAALVWHWRSLLSLDVLRGGGFVKQVA